MTKDIWLSLNKHLSSEGSRDTLGWPKSDATVDYLSESTPWQSSTQQSVQGRKWCGETQLSLLPPQIPCLSSSKTHHSLVMKDSSSLIIGRICWWGQRLTLLTAGAQALLSSCRRSRAAGWLSPARRMSSTGVVDRTSYRSQSTHAYSSLLHSYNNRSGGLRQGLSPGRFPADGAWVARRAPLRRPSSVTSCLPLTQENRYKSYANVIKLYKMTPFRNECSHDTERFRIKLFHEKKRYEFWNSEARPEANEKM